MLKERIVPISERGKYTFWKLEDLLIKEEFKSGYFLNFKRCEADNLEKDINVMEDEIDRSLFNKRFFCMINDKKMFKINKFESNNQKGFAKKIYINSLDKANIKWIIDSKKNESYEISLDGAIEKKSFKEMLNIKIDFPIQKILIDIIEKNNNNFKWNSLKKTFDIKNVEELDFNNYNKLVDFETELNISEVEIEAYGKFDSCIIYEIPITPSNEKEAEKWVSLYIDNIVKENYINEKDFDDLINFFKENENFKNYQEIFNNLKIDNFLCKYKDSGNKNNYIHLQAPRDLNVEINEKNILAFIHVTKNERLSFKKLVEKILVDKKPNELVFYSKYLVKGRQIKKFELFLDSFIEKGLDKLILISTNKIDSIIENKKIEYKIEECDKIFKSKKDQPHDRYFAFKSSNKWFYYKMTAELDQCNFENNNYSEWSIENIGIWNDISILLIEEDIFPTEIIKHTKDRGEEN